ncbi:MAG: isoaspartyl peptidase/L-asparaginase family protein [Alphaproteobacteria bacterium]
MRRLLCLALATLAGTFAAAPSRAACEAQETFAIAVHGGTSRAGRDHTPRMLFQTLLLKAMRVELASGAAALDVVEQSVRFMEDSGLFNAGRAAISNRDGFVETDASIMDGRTLEAGAVASMRLLRNPITAARLVMEKTPHVMMVGDRGEAAAVALGADTVTADYFVNNKTADAPANHGTVGAVVLDRCGNLAAGTSTGGYGAKIPGRVGDSPVIGAGTYARNGSVAVSATGHGEYFIRFNAAASIAARVTHGGEDLASASAAVIEAMAKAGGGRDGRGGVIVVGADGSVATPFSTDGMIRATTTNTVEPVAMVYGKGLKPSDG